MLDIVDCTDHCAPGKKKDAKFIAKMFLPLIEKTELATDVHGNKQSGIVDMVFFNGARTVQNSGKILVVRYPCITVGHGAEHVVALFFSGVFTKIDEFVQISNFTKKARNVFGSTRHAPTVMFSKHSKLYNMGRPIGFVKPSKCRYVPMCYLAVLYYYDQCEYSLLLFLNMPR